LFDLNNRDGTVALFIIGAVKPWGQGNKAFSLQGKQKLPAGHILKTAIGLPPVPLLAKDSGNMLSALVPMTVDRGLNRRNVLFGNGSFSDGKRQHFNCISERIRGRQQKMYRNEKKVTGVVER